MKAKFIISCWKLNDLLEITEYTAVKLYNPEAALKQAERIRDAVNYAAEHPYISCALSCEKAET